MLYLAQHPLLSQIPELQSDIRIPDYCCCRGAASEEDEEKRPEEEEVQINAWIGPRGTVSCLHYDAPHNLLAQVVGSKRILLWAPAADSAAAGCGSAGADDKADVLRAPDPESRPRRCMYPHEGMMCNTSRVDPLVLYEARDKAAVDHAGHGGDSSSSHVLAAEFEAFPSAPDHHVVLRAGEMLYIPPGWWHHVTAETLSVSVSFWWPK